ncbi:MAG: pitrilysin family protein [bacterium]|nr:pitrilysin family protein [bacterium]
MPRFDPFSFKRRELRNGIPVYANLGFPVEAVVIALIFFAGSRDEEPGTEGSAHFMEHMPFRGTERFLNQKSLSAPIEDRGGVLNAFTSSEHIVFWAKTAPEDIRYATDALGEMAWHARFRPKDFAEERAIVIQEYVGNIADVTTMVAKTCYAELFRGHPLARMPLGELTALKTMELKDVRSFYERHIRQNSFALAVLGGAEECPVFDALEKRFGAFRPERILRRVPAAPPEARAARLIVVDEPYSASAFFMAAPTFPFGDGRRLVAARVLECMAGSGLSAPLVLALRERENLVYSFHFQYDGWSDAGAFEFGALTKFAYTDRLIDAFFRALHRLKGDRARLLAAKKLILKRDRMADVKIGTAFEEFIEYASVGLEPVSRETRHAYINAVTMDEIDELITRELARERFTQVVVKGQAD